MYRSLGEQLSTCVESKQDFWVLQLCLKGRDYAARLDSRDHKGLKLTFGLGEFLEGGLEGAHCSCVTWAYVARVSHCCAGCSTAWSTSSTGLSENKAYSFERCVCSKTN